MIHMPLIHMRVKTKPEAGSAGKYTLTVQLTHKVMSLEERRNRHDLPCVKLWLTSLRSAFVSRTRPFTFQISSPWMNIWKKVLPSINTMHDH